MAETFVGLGLHVVLASGTWVEGVVSHIDQHTRLLTLKNVTVGSNGNTEKRTIYAVAGSEIKDLEILPSPNQTSLQQQRPGQVTGSHAYLTENVYTATNGITTTPKNNGKLVNSQQSSTLLHKSPPLDPAIISYSQAPSSMSLNSYLFSGSSPPYNTQTTPSLRSSEQGEQKDSAASPNFTKSSSTPDNDWKNEEDKERDGLGALFNFNSTPNGNHYEGEASGFESDARSPARRPGRRRINYNNRRHNHEWAGGDVNDFKSEEFDFQGNLDLFDKAAVFAELREMDETAPENLLVNLNRNINHRSNSRYTSFRNRSGQVKLSASENVLDMSARKSIFYNSDEDEISNDGEVDSDDPWSKKKKVNGVSSHKSVKIRTLTGVSCPSVQPYQMVEAEKIAAIETGPNEDQMIENAGRSAAMMVLQALGGSRRIQPNNHNAAPLVTILVGNNKTGSYGLATARHLANHGCHVVACVVGKEKDLLKNVAYQQKILLSTGGRVVKSVAELPHQFTNPVDLIVDALLGYQFTLRDITDDSDRRLICSLMEWANINKAPVLSLDMPSGVNGATGIPGNAAHHIHPKWTLCLGAPKTGCKSRTVTGELFLADIGIPRICWKKVGIKGW
ncbi:2990_t:CDS:10, partial [Paraglomus occultum]